MARLSDGRAPVEPVNAQQVDRWNRILNAAEQLGARESFEQVQMSEVARCAGVALGTVYRYFPSKTWLFTLLFQSRIGGLMTDVADRRYDDPVTAIENYLLELNRELLRRPVLATAMMQSTVIGLAQGDQDQVNRIESTMVGGLQSLLGEQGTNGPTLRLIRLVAYSWWGALVSVLRQQVSEEEGEDELRSAIDILLRSANHPRAGAAATGTDGIQRAPQTRTPASPVSTGRFG